MCEYGSWLLMLENSIYVTIISNDAVWDSCSALRAALVFHCAVIHAPCVGGFSTGLTVRS